MERYFKRKLVDPTSTSDNTIDENIHKESWIELDLNNLPADPGLRIKICAYHPNVRDTVRRSYLQKGPCQPQHHEFPQKNIGGKLRRFNPNWFHAYRSWLEYSIAKDAAFCLCCYLFRPEHGKQGCGDSFVINGFTALNKLERLRIHVEGGPNSLHNQAWRKCEDLMRQEQHIDVALCKQSEQVRIDYRIPLTASIDCVRFLLRQGLAFRGRDESEYSTNRGNFLELLQFLADHNEEIATVVLRNAPENLKLVTSDIQKDIISASAIETTNAIINDIGDELFAVLIDESRDISVKEQMAVVLRYVDKRGCVIERLLGIVHVTDTAALSLKSALESLFSTYGLSLLWIRGQGYDGGSNMRGEFSGLKTLVMKDNSSPYYVHCFAH